MRSAIFRSGWNNAGRLTFPCRSVIPIGDNCGLILGSGVLVNVDWRELMQRVLPGVNAMDRNLLKCKQRLRLRSSGYIAFALSLGLVGSVAFSFNGSLPGTAALAKNGGGNGGNG